MLEWLNQFVSQLASVAGRKGGRARAKESIGMSNENAKVVASLHLHQVKGIQLHIGQ